MSQTWFITRHPGAVEWARLSGVKFDRVEAHLELDKLSPGDSVIGILPVNLAAEVCERGSQFFNL